MCARCCRPREFCKCAATGSCEEYKARIAELEADKARLLGEKAETAIARRRVRRREWALWIAAGVLVAAAVWRLQ
jgi:hypothetical protein